jgi:RNA polymerase sigma-70 factor (ECF subfamily)
MDDERELARRAKEGDREAFGDLVRLYQARLRAYTARYVPGPEDVFDIVQDAFIDALDHLDRFDLARDFGPWLRAICRHRMLNHFRSRRTGRSAAAALVDQALEESRGPMEDDLEAAGARLKALQRCLGRLEPSHRELIDQRYRREVPLADLARRMGRSAAALAMALLRIRAALQKCMERGLEADTP